MSGLSECTVLIVEDTVANVDILIGTLNEDYTVCVAIDGKGALERVKTTRPDLILLDIMMPGMSGYEVCRQIKSNPATCDIPIIFLTALHGIENKTKGFNLGAVDYITKPFELTEIKARVKTHLSLMLAKKELSMHNSILEETVIERTKQLVATQDALTFSMAALAEFRDPDTGGHITRTQSYIKALTSYLKSNEKFKGLLDREIIRLLYNTAPLHDIGKVGVPDSVLLKPGKLTIEEFEEMKKHTLYGKAALKVANDKLNYKCPFLKLANEIAFTHHEKWDGSGYPRGLNGKEIPLPGRLMALADVYDALISKRVYKQPLPHKEAVGIIIDGIGTHFDPDIGESFIAINEDFRSIALKFADFEEERTSLLLN